MININELRIGNWYSIKNPLSGKSEWEQFTNWTQALDFEGYGEGVKIDGELLKQLGWTKDNYDVFYLKLNEENYLWIKFFAGTWQICVGQELDNLRQIASVNFIHTIQTIFYSLTGQELEFKK